jgi:hypothetical protein
MNTRTPETDIDPVTPLTQDELFEGILDELAGIRLALVNAIRMQTIPPAIRDHVIVDEDGVISVPAPTHPPLEPVASRDERRARFQAAIKP